MSFLSSLAEEFGARRNRMRARIGDRWASLVEFLVLGTLSLAAMRGLVRAEGWAIGFAPLAGAIMGYALLDLRRQRALAGGEPEGLVRQRHDRWTIAFLATAAASGFLTFALAYLPERVSQIELPEQPPENARYIELE